MNPKDLRYGPNSNPTQYQEQMRRIYEILKKYPEYRETLPDGTLTYDRIKEVLASLEGKVNARPKRETVINDDDVLNLRIAMETMTFNEFVEAM